MQTPDWYQTERLMIRPHHREEAEEIFYSYASKTEVTRYVTWATHSSIDDTRRYLRQAIAQRSEDSGAAYTIRLKRPNRVVGSIGLVHVRGEWQVGYVYSPTVWGNGLATEALIGLFQAIECQLDESIFSYVHPDNKASVRVLEKAGFVRDGLVVEGFSFPNLGGQVHPCIRFRLKAGDYEGLAL